MRIDAHQHFWKLSRENYDWPTPDLTTLYRDFLPEDLEENLKKHQIDKTIVVQAIPTVEETEFLLDLYDTYDFIAGVVGWIDLSSDQFANNIFTRLKSRPGFVGIRPMLQNMEDDKWILRPEVKKNIKILVEYDFSIDILIFPRHLPYILELLEEFPTLRAVIDHSAKPFIKNKQFEPWAELIEKIAKFDSVMCKLSGLVTEADHIEWQINDFKPYIQHVIHCFGTKRTMFGSDWPVCLLAASYDEVISILSENLPIEEKEWIFGENARKFYQL